MHDARRAGVKITALLGDLDCPPVTLQKDTQGRIAPGNVLNVKAPNLFSIQRSLRGGLMVLYRSNNLITFGTVSNFGRSTAGKITITIP